MTSRILMTSLLGSAAFLSIAPSLHAENEISFYGVMALLSEDTVRDEWDKFPGGSDAFDTGQDGAFTPGYGFRYTYWTAGHFGIALDFNAYGLGGDVDQDTLELFNRSLIGLYRMSSSSQWEPYFGAGIGSRLIEQFANNDDGTYEATYDSGWSFTGLGGVKYHLNDNFSVFGELRMDYATAQKTSTELYTDVSGEFGALLTPSLNLGLSVRF